MDEKGFFFVLGMEEYNNILDFLFFREVRVWNFGWVSEWLL